MLWKREPDWLRMEHTIPRRQVSTREWVERGPGVLTGAATLISLAQGGFNIELHGLAAKVFQQYVWLRDTLFSPLVLMLEGLGMTLPWWGKDVLVAYGLVILLAIVVALSVYVIVPNSGLQD